MTGGTGVGIDSAGQTAIILGSLEAVLAGDAGPVGAVGADFGEVALVFGGQVECSQDGADVGASKDDSVGIWFRPGLGVRQLGGVAADAGGEVPGAVVDAGQLGDHVDGLTGVLGVASVMAVAFQDGDDLGDQPV